MQEPPRAACVVEKGWGENEWNAKAQNEIMRSGQMEEIYTN
jgi:hypothetical protein